MKNRTARRAVVIAVLLVGAVVSPATAAVIKGTPGPDVLRGTAGPDRIYAGRGADKVYGGRGADRLFPGDDARVDVLRGGPGPDRIFARTGRGLTPGGEVKGRDRVYAGPGDDVVTIRENWGWYTPFIDCGAGHDTVVVPFRMVPTEHCEHLVTAR